MELQELALSFLHRYGWSAVGTVPEFKKMVLIAAPHTSNWDLLWMLAVGVAMDVRVNWVGKHTLFEGTFGPIFTALGGLPVDRRSRNNAVEQMAAHFDERDELAMAISPEGTRGYTDHWKTGFYYIAKEANVPIVCGFLDYATKTGGIGKVIWPLGTLEEVMEECREFYEGLEGHTPEAFGPVRLKDD